MFFAPGLFEWDRLKTLIKLLPKCTENILKAQRNVLIFRIFKLVENCIEKFLKYSENVEKSTQSNCYGKIWNLLYFESFNGL